MKYEQTALLSNGTEALIRNGDAADGIAVLEVFNRTHEETDYLLSYPDENNFEPKQEAQLLKEKALSPNETELVAIVDGKIVGSAGIEPVGKHHKVRHRAEFGIGVLQAYWGLGLGKALTKACIQCAKDAGYDQLELNVVAQNDRALKRLHAGAKEGSHARRGAANRRNKKQDHLRRIPDLRHVNNGTVALL